MSYVTPEQVLAANKTNVETLFDLTNKAIEGVEKLIDLNMQVAKSAIGELADNAKAAMSVKDAQELLSLQTGLMQPAAEKAASYSRHLYDIVAATGAEVTKLAEAQAAEVQKVFMSAVDTAVKNAPAGSESAVSLVKSAIVAANNAYESVNKAAKQAADRRSQLHRRDQQRREGDPERRAQGQARRGRLIDTASKSRIQQFRVGAFS